MDMEGKDEDTNEEATELARMRPLTSHQELARAEGTASRACTCRQIGEGHLTGGTLRERLGAAREECAQGV